MFQKNNFFLLLCLACFEMPAQVCDQTEIVKKIIYTLADDSMQGREAGTNGAKKAEVYLVNYFKMIGLKPINNSFVQTFSFLKDSTQEDTAMNVCGVIDNKANSTILIGAHYDHLGMGGTKSRSLTNKKIHPGADDNASGIAMMLMLAEQLKKSGNRKFNYMFVAFSAHEDGLYGSQAFVNKEIVDLSKLKLMLNFDMVGRLDNSKPLLKVTKNESAFYLDTLLNIPDHKKIEIKIYNINSIKSDATAFIDNKIPTLTFSTGMHDDYHKTSDTAEKINYEGMEFILKYVEKVLANVN